MVQRPRFIAALALLALLVAFLAVVARQSPPAQGSPAATPPPTTTAALPQRFTDPRQCQRCHAVIYQEWLEDQHATAYAETDFVVFTENYARVECLTCHTPQPMLETGVTAQPRTRDATRATGVDCLSCHIKDGRPCGATGQGEACRAMKEPLLATAQACYHCHSTHNLFKEYLASGYPEKGYTCQDCHMERLTRPVADGAAPRQSRRHLMHGGGHDLEGLKKALTLALKVERNRLTVTVTNVGSAHGVPGEINNRGVRLEVFALRRPTAQEKAEGWTGGWVETLARRALFRAPPRFARDRIPSTQVMPNEARVLTYALPEDTPHGKVRATLSYFLEYDSPVNHPPFVILDRELEF